MWVLHLLGNVEDVVDAQSRHDLAVRRIVFSAEIEQWQDTHGFKLVRVSRGQIVTCIILAPRKDRDRA